MFLFGDDICMSTSMICLYLLFSTQKCSPMPAGMESFVPSRNSNKLLYCKAAPPFYLPRKFCACRIESDAAWMGTSASQMAGVQW